VDDRRRRHFGLAGVEVDADPTVAEAGDAAECGGRVAAAHPSDSDAGEQASATEMVEGRDLLGEDKRLAVRQDEHVRAERPYRLRGSEAEGG